MKEVIFSLATLTLSTVILSIFVKKPFSIKVSIGRMRLTVKCEDIEKEKSSGRSRAIQ